MQNNTGKISFIIFIKAAPFYHQTIQTVLYSSSKIISEKFVSTGFVFI